MRASCDDCSGERYFHAVDPQFVRAGTGQSCPTAVDFATPPLDTAGGPQSLREVKRRYPADFAADGPARRCAAHSEDCAGSLPAGQEHGGSPRLDCEPGEQLRLGLNALNWIRVYEVGITQTVRVKAIGLSKFRKGFFHTGRDSGRRYPGSSVPRHPVNRSVPKNSYAAALFVSRRYSYHNSGPGYKTSRSLGRAARKLTRVLSTTVGFP
jgi:hypothetical protein